MAKIKHIFIVNPCSGKNHAAVTYAEKIEETAKRLGIDYEIVTTQYAGHALKIVSERVATNEKIRFYACGGDGTLNEVFSQAYKHDNAQVASVPCGSGNDFVRNFGTAEDFLDIEDNIKGEPIRIDLLSVNDKISHDIASCGLDANVAHDMVKFKNLPFISGKLSYNLSIILQMLKPIGRKFTLEVDGERIEGNFLLVAFCNGKTYGSGILASPFSKLHDGVLEVVYVSKISRLKIAVVIKDYKAGTHLTQNEEVREDLKEIIHYKKAKNIKLACNDKKGLVVNIDGECFVTDKLDIKVMPLAAQFVLPKKIMDATLIGNS